MRPALCWDLRNLLAVVTIMSSSSQVSFACRIGGMEMGNGDLVGDEEDELLVSGWVLLMFTFDSVFV